MSALTLYAPIPASVPVIGCSPPSWMVRLALEEKGLDHRLETLSFADGEHRSEEMLALSPRGTIPVLTDGDAVLTETAAILTWLELTRPEPSLLGDSAPERARALDLFQASLLVKDAGMALLAGWMRAGGDRAEAVAGAVTGPAERFAHALEPFEASLWDRRFAAGGDRPSLADLTLFTYFTAVRRLGLLADAELPGLEAHAGRMRERASVQATWPFAEGDGR